ncbi:cytochrome c peroxidase [Ideonella sp. DXS29W]|uniref:Cytochrome c peroxidase n=1 Tax=Ideonella lacteola TaxID=2984193 RepID=A0ABU9BRN9_9BURK
MKAVAALKAGGAALVAGSLVLAAPPAPMTAAETSAVQAKEQLGRRLFFDARLSSDGRVSCASCHKPEHAFSDGKPVAEGIGGRLGSRNTPSLVDVGAQRSFFWDGRRATLEDQALDPLLNPLEHGLRGASEMLALLKSDGEYAAQFRQSFGLSPEEAEPITAARVAQALSAFERRLVDGRSAFDRYRAGDATALPIAAQRGWQLFSGVAACTRCHTAEGPKPLLTDHGFHSLGVGMKDIERQLPSLVRQLGEWHDDGRAQDHSILRDPGMAALGRFVVTLDPKDIGKFKTPGLRNVALTAPYMHDGSVATLEEAVEREIYYRGKEDGHPLILTPTEKGELVAFLESLSGWPSSAYNLGGQRPDSRD